MTANSGPSEQAHDGLQEPLPEGNLLSSHKEPESKTLSPVRVDANRANASHSTGPRSDRGKLAVRHNACRHGLAAQTAVIPGEDVREYEEHLQRIYDQYSPVGPIEEHFVQEICDAIWRLRRARRFETLKVTTTIQTKQADVNDPQHLSPTEFENTSAGIRELLDLLEAAECGVKESGTLSTLPWERLGSYCGHSPYFASVLDSEDPTCEQVLQAITKYRDHLKNLRSKVKARERKVSRRIKGLNSLPPEQTLNRLHRYETTIRRQLDRDLRTLERLQAQRKERGQDPK